jgi:hypothetical protein
MEKWLQVDKYRVLSAQVSTVDFEQYKMGTDQELKLENN